MSDANPFSRHPTTIVEPTSIYVASPSAVPSSPLEGSGVGCPDDMGFRGLALATSHSPLLEDTTAQPFPLPSTCPQALPTPLQEERLDLSFNFAGPALPSTDVSLPTSPIAKVTPNLRLPSFDLLGIAAPHPDRFPLQPFSAYSPLGAGPLSKPEDPLHALSPSVSQTPQVAVAADPPVESPQRARARLSHRIPVMTPPVDSETFHWGSFVHVSTTATAGSPPNSEPGASPGLNVSTIAPAPAPATTPDVLSVAQLGEALPMAGWVERVKQIITSNTQSQYIDSVKVLSHALPCPSLIGHLFGQIIAAIHDRATTPTAWINVFHAVPGRFTLEELPKSPPSTPGPVVGGDEYFTSKVFDTAVAVPDYQFGSMLLPPSPRPVVPPGSVNVSVVERYIPPTNVNEFAEMFSRKGRSLLHDRLVELSSDNGMLLFIYPTKTGARTFMQDYLSPVLDPLLRSITVIHELSAELGRSLGPMSSVERLLEYRSLYAEVDNFCTQLSESATNLHVAREKRATYNVIYASKEEIVLDRDAWARDWWTKQEKARVRETVTRCVRKINRLPATDSDVKDMDDGALASRKEMEVTPTTIIQEILDGVLNGESQKSGELRGIEVGVFIIRKST